MWFFGLDVERSWVGLSSPACVAVDCLNVFGYSSAPLQGKSSREAVLSAVMDDLVIVLANKD